MTADAKPGEVERALEAADACAARPQEKKRLGPMFGGHLETLAAAYREVKREHSLCGIKGLMDEATKMLQESLAADVQREKERAERAEKSLEVQKEDNRNLADQVNRMAKERNALKAEVLRLMDEIERLDKDPGRTGRDALAARLEKAERLADAAKAVSEGWSNNTSNAGELFDQLDEALAGFRAVE